jgi:hypothetical protein
MRARLFITLLLLGAALPGVAAPAEGGDGIVPEGARVVTLACLPEVPRGAEANRTVRLTPAGVPMALYRGRLFTLPERPDATPADWAPPPDPEPLRDFCWLDEHTLALLRTSALDFVRDGQVVRGVALPSRGMRLARADSGHCYVFGGVTDPLGREVLLVGADGALRNLFRAPATVTAVAGDGANTFVAVGPMVYYMAPKQEPRAIFQEREPILELAHVPSVGVFYRTAGGVGCIENPVSGAVFLQGAVESIDGRSGRLVLLTPAREVLLIAPLAGFPRLVQDVRQLAAKKERP